VEKPLRAYWLNLITETVNAIKLLDHRLQNAFRIMVTNKLKQIYNANNSVKIIHKRHQYITNNIKHKITAGNAMLARADKGRTTVVMYKHDYDIKVYTFLTENDIQPIPKRAVSTRQSNKYKIDCASGWLFY
jgi:hypothetical protein